MSRPRSSGALRAVIITLLVVAALVVGADRLAAWWVGREMTNQLTSAARQHGGDLDGASVTIHGFPFLTQLLDGGDLDHVSARLAAGTFGGFQVRDVVVDARGLEPLDPFTVETANVTALLPFAAVEGLIAEQVGAAVSLSDAGGGNLRLTTSLAGFDVGAIVAPTARPHAIDIAVVNFVIAGATVGADSLPPGVGGHFVGLSVPLQLPTGITLVAAGATPGGLSIAAQGRNIALANLAF
ncbi:MAG: DUF2993 domain-containing protein [Promicromonosporaceae bacterium]|nr:DUF2993 domain-containing protein [Promicromonosporaceae bacterium]